MLGLSPFRLFCKGVSSEICNLSNEEGFPYYVALAIGVLDWAHHQNVVVESLLYCVLVTLFLASQFVESILWGGLRHLAVAIGITVAFWKTCISSQAKEKAA